MDNSIWKAPDGSFYNVINPTPREIAILTVLGCKRFQSPQEFIYDIDNELNRKPYDAEAHSAMYPGF